VRSRGLIAGTAADAAQQGRHQLREQNDLRTKLALRQAGSEAARDVRCEQPKKPRVIIHGGAVALHKKVTSTPRFKGSRSVSTTRDRFF